MTLDFEKDGIKFHAENGWAKAEKDGKELWRSIDVFKDIPPTEELVLGLHKMITDSWYLREEEEMIGSDCPCEDGIDSKTCAGCPQDDAKKGLSNKELTEKMGAVITKTWVESGERAKKIQKAFADAQAVKVSWPYATTRPFKDCDELVEFWIKHYQSTNKPMYTKPLIWVRLKVDKRERIIVAFGTDFVEIGNKAKAVPLQKLFDDYEFLDGSPVGMEVEK